MKRWIAVMGFLLLLLAVSSALGEVSVSVNPENPRVGDYVNVIVTPDRENPESVSYALFYGDNLEKVFAGKPVQHYDVWCRPRKEGDYTLRITVAYDNKDKETAEVVLPVSGFAPDQEGTDVIYSQKDGWWKKVKYSSSELQTSGCAIFTLSHLLQRAGFTGEDVTPSVLAKTYVYYKEDSGTWNEGLIRYSAVDYDFTTQKELFYSPEEIAACFRRGDRFSFSIVDRHIALADAISEDGTKVHIVDSAPGATYERIRFPGKIFIQNADGSFTEAASPEDHPGVRWFFETAEYGGLEYWMDLEYCANRGMRLVRFPWLKADPGDGGGARSVVPETVGALLTKVTKDKESWRIPTRDLQITGIAPEEIQVAIVTNKKGTMLKDISGKQIPKKAKIKRNMMVLLLGGGTEDLLYAWWDNGFGYVTKADVEILPAAEGDFETGVIAKNGNTSGAQKITAYLNPDGKTGVVQWETGTPVAVVEKQNGYWLLEGNGQRGWVREKYIVPDQENTSEGGEENGQEINEGE